MAVAVGMAVGEALATGNTAAVGTCPATWDIAVHFTTAPAAIDTGGCPIAGTADTTLTADNTAVGCALKFVWPPLTGLAVLVTLSSSPADL